MLAAVVVGLLVSLLIGLTVSLLVRLTIGLLVGLTVSLLVGLLIVSTIVSHSFFTPFCLYCNCTYIMALVCGRYV